MEINMADKENPIEIEMQGVSFEDVMKCVDGLKGAVSGGEIAEVEISGNFTVTIKLTRRMDNERTDNV